MSHLICEQSPQQCVARSDMPPTGFRLTEHEQVAGPVSLVVAIVTRLGPDSGPLISHQLLGCLVEADHGIVRVVVLMVPHILHSSHELPAHLRDAPLLLLPRLEFVFLSIWRTVSREMLSANPIATALSAMSCMRPVRVAFDRCTRRLSGTCFCPGRVRSVRVPPSQTACVHAVDALRCYGRSDLATPALA